MSHFPAHPPFHLFAVVDSGSATERPLKTADKTKDLSRENAIGQDTRVARGMPGIPGITEAQLEALQHFIRQRARETLLTS